MNKLPIQDITQKAVAAAFMVQCIAYGLTKGFKTLAVMLINIDIANLGQYLSQLVEIMLFNWEGITKAAIVALVLPYFPIAVTALVFYSFVRVLFSTDAF